MCVGGLWCGGGGGGCVVVVWWGGCVVVVLCGRGSGVVFVAEVCIVRCCVVVVYGRTCGVVGSVWWWRCGVW